jgi:hypothetical protein
MFGQVGMKDVPSIMRNHEKAIEYAEGKGRNGKEIHCGDGLTMIVQKSRPSVCRLRISWRFPHPTQHGSLGNIEAQHLQLTMNTRRAPSGVLGNHPEDKSAQFPAHALSSCTAPMSREPRPIQLEPGSMPPHNSFWLHQNQRLSPTPPDPPQHHPEQAVNSNKSWLRTSPLQSHKLLPKCQVIQDQIATRAKTSSKENSQEPQRAQHKASLTR